jgi:ATP-dependent helicase HepA
LYQLITRDGSDDEFQGLQKETQTLCVKLAHELEEGRDKILELASFDPVKAQEIVDLMEENDCDMRLEKFMLKVFRIFGVNYDDNFDGTYILSASETFNLDIPEYNKEGMTITFMRDIALAREEVDFLSWDHPLVRGVIDLLCSTPKGNSCFSFEKRKDGSRELILEGFFVLETMAPAKLHVDRFLPPTLISTSVNHLKEDVKELVKNPDFYHSLRRGNPQRVLGNPSIRDGLLPNLVSYCTNQAEKEAEEIRSECIERLRERADYELSRLHQLKEVNSAVTQEEIDQMATNYDELEKYIQSAQLRLDSVRFIYCGDELKSN